MSFVMKVDRIDRTAAYVWIPDGKSMSIYIGNNLVHLDQKDTEELWEFLQTYFTMKK